MMPSPAPKICVANSSTTRPENVSARRSLPMVTRACAQPRTAATQGDPRDDHTDQSHRPEAVSDPPPRYSWGASRSGAAMESDREERAATMRAAVTGGAGFIGHHPVGGLLWRGH